MRKNASFIDAFRAHLEGRGSPDIWVKWGAIWCVAAALERRCFIRTAKGQLFPNQYNVIVGPPGAGKTLATAFARELLDTLEDFHLAPTSVTKASLIDSLNDSDRSIVDHRDLHNPVTKYNALAVTSDEFGVFLTAYENEFINTLTTLYDCRVYSETRRTNKLSIEIKQPILSLHAATTPSYLNDLMPDGAWDQGFASRTLFIYSGESEPTSLFGGLEADITPKDLLHDINQIYSLRGKFTFTEDAAVAIDDWHMRKGPPAPNHPKLTHYNTRRTGHLLKLCMAVSASNRDSMEINLEDFAEALSYLLEAEAVMPDIFKAMKTGGDSRVMEECYHFVYTLHVRDKKPVAEFRIIQFLSERTPGHNVERLLQVMEKAGLLKKQFGNDGGMCYLPMGKNGMAT